MIHQINQLGGGINKTRVSDIIALITQMPNGTYAF